MHVSGSPPFPQQLGQISDGLNWLCLDLEGIKHQGRVNVLSYRYAEKQVIIKRLNVKTFFSFTSIIQDLSWEKKMKNKNIKGGRSEEHAKSTCFNVCLNSQKQNSLTNQILVNCILSNDNFQTSIAFSSTPPGLPGFHGIIIYTGIYNESLGCFHSHKLVIYAQQPGNLKPFCHLQSIGAAK